jgi:hypothetical protein
VDWPKHITVDKRIVQILSGSTYENFPKAVRELVTNSYDADATEVKISFDKVKQRMIVSDNGSGMSESDLDLYFRIAGRRREKTPRTRSGRQIVGQFGVGFLSVFPFCREFRIESKRKGTDEAVFAKIPTARYFTADNRLVDVSDIVIEGGTIAISPADKEKSYTNLELIGFTRLTEAFFNEGYGTRKRKNTIGAYDAFDRLIWQLKEDLPLQYEDKAIEEIIQPPRGAPLRVFANGKELLRPTYGKSVLEKHRGEYQECGKIKFRFVILTDYKAVQPVEARFLKIRNLNVGVGERTTFGVGTTGPRSRLHHLSGEIHVLEGLNDLLSVNRDQFNYSVDYEDMKEFFASKLRWLSNQLEDLHDIDSLSSKNEGATRVGNVKLLDRSNMQKMVARLEKSGFKVKTASAKETAARASVAVDRESKTITVPAAPDTLYGKVDVLGATYSLKLDTWDWHGEPLFPACRVEDHTIVINRTYPLFKQRKYTDIFVKLHMLLIKEYEKGTLPRKAYQALVENLLGYFDDYVKGA